MAIGDLLFGLMGQPNPSMQIAQGLGQMSGMPGSRSGPVPGPGAGAAAPGLAQQGSAANSAAPPPQFEQAANNQSPQPQAFQSPPDLANLYLKVLQRQQSNQMINSGLGLIAGYFEHRPGGNAQIQNTMNQMSTGGLGAGGAGGGMGGLVDLIKAQREMQMQSYMMGHINEGAKAMGISPQEYLTAYMTGTLGQLQDKVISERILEASPKYKSDIAEAQARTGLTTAQTGAVPSEIAARQAQTGLATAQAGAIPSEIAGREATTAEAKARTAAIPAQTAETVARTQQAQAATAEAQLTTKQKTDLLNSAPALAQANNMSEPMTRSLIESGGWPSYATEMQKFKLQQASPLYQAQTAEAQANAAKLAQEQATRNSLLANADTLAKQHNMTLDDTKSAITTGNWDKIVAAEQEAKMRSSLVAQETAERVTAENKAKAVPMALEAADKLREVMNLGDQVKNDPNLGYLTGPGSLVGGVMKHVPGAQTADLQAKIDQLEGTTGVEAVKSLIGGGRVLGTEFTEGFHAQSRLGQQHVSTNSYQGAINDYQSKSAGEAWTLFKMANLPASQLPKEVADHLPKWARDEYDASMKGVSDSDEALLKKYIK